MFSCLERVHAEAVPLSAKLELSSTPPLRFREWYALKIMSFTHQIHFWWLNIGFLIVNCMPDFYFLCRTQVRVKTLVFNLIFNVDTLMVCSCIALCLLSVVVIEHYQCNLFGALSTLAFGYLLQWHD